MKKRTISKLTVANCLPIAGDNIILPEPACIGRSQKSPNGPEVICKENTKGFKTRNGIIKQP